MKSAGNEIRSIRLPFQGSSSLHNEITILSSKTRKPPGLLAFTHLNNMTMEIPQGNTREDNKARKQIIKDYYASWIALHPDKRIWNDSLKSFIYVKGQSINETAGHASLSFESTQAVLQMTEILQKATVKETWAPKHGNKNQKPYSKMHLLRWKNYRLIIGYQKSRDEWVQYYIGSEQIKKAVR